MRHHLTTSATLGCALVLALLLAPKADASDWGFRGVEYSNGDVLCSGEAGEPWWGDSCDLTSSGGARVTAHDFGGFCAASIWCGQVVKTCLASDSRSSRWPVMCFAVGYATGFARAECKSDNGNYYLTCD
jgi:hypothetical protein